MRSNEIKASFKRIIVSNYEQYARLLGHPIFDLHQIYRVLSVPSENSNLIQTDLDKRLKKVIKYNTGVLFYDFTNLFFELEQEKDLQLYGHSKENHHSPITQMGLFMNKSGIPLAFCINAGNQNEQLSLKPPEQQIMLDFNLSKFVVCANAGLPAKVVIITGNEALSRHSW